MGAELTLRYAGTAELEQDFESNLKKGRAFVPGAAGLSDRTPCVLRIEHPTGGAALELPAEAVWISHHPETGGIGLELVQFDSEARDSLRAFVATSEPPPRTFSGMRARVTLEELSAEAAESADPDASPESGRALRNLHDRVRDLSLADRDSLARQGTLPERVALERRFGSSVWEGLLQNPQLTVREVCHMAKSPNLPTNLVNLMVSHAGWVSDSSIRTALLGNPRVSGAHLERVLRACSQNELRALAEQSSLRIQVRAGAKRLIRR